MRSGRNWRSKELSERFLIATKRECPWGGNSPLLSCICLFACFHYTRSPVSDVRPLHSDTCVQDVYKHMRKQLWATTPEALPFLRVILFLILRCRTTLRLQSFIPSGSIPTSRKFRIGVHLAPFGFVWFLSFLPES